MHLSIAEVEARTSRPFLATFRRVGAIPMRVVLTDFGQVLESNPEKPLAPLDTSMLKRCVDTGKPQISLVEEGTYPLVVTMSWPVLYASTGLPEVTIAFQFDFALLNNEVCSRGTVEDFRLLFQNSSRGIDASIMQGKRPPRTALVQKSGVDPVVRRVSPMGARGRSLGG